MSYDQTLIKPQGRVLATLEEDGSRRWLHPKLSRGRFWKRRRAVAYFLIALFMALPNIRVHGKPAMLLDVVHRRFTLLGVTFLPTDTLLLALFAVSTLLTIFFVTALLGRVWCGWACPQTVYLEFVFRPIERLFDGRKGAGGKPRKDVPGWRTAGKYIAYVLASLIVAHTFLAYFVGTDQLRHWVTGSPAEHLTAFLVVIVTTALMLFNFAFFREQTCTIACPYGRFQSVLLDRQSMIISYDERRGEPRGAIKKTSLPVLEKRGDCIDCEMCVSVCPTGIDIRQGLQLECIGCAQCIDACDSVMRKVGRQVGLIRYSSQSGMAGEPVRVLRARVIVYATIVAVLLGLLTLLIVTRPPADVTLLRGLGRPFVINAAGEVDNSMRIKITNRSDRRQRLQVTVVEPRGVRAQMTDESIELAPGESRVEPVQVLAPPSMFNWGTLDAMLRITGKGVEIDRPCRLLGPMSTLPTESEHERHEHERD